MLVATGGALGAILRYLLTNISKSMFASSIYGTISVNILGSFLIGYFITSNIGNNLSENFVKFFLIIGLLGSFTTFSAFSYEAIDLISSNLTFKKKNIKLHLEFIPMDLLLIKIAFPHNSFMMKT